MKLSDLIAYRNQLLTQDINDIEYNAVRKLAEILYTVKTSVIQPRSFTQTLGEDNDGIITGFRDFKATFSEIVQELNAMIDVAEKSYYTESSKLYNEESARYGKLDSKTNADVNQQILNRRLVMVPETQQMLSNRIKNYVDWKYPALIIRPGLEQFINDMVGFDPLYIVDWGQELLDPAALSFGDEYRRRLRLYEQPPTSTDILGNIPKNQLNLCLAFNFFEYTPIEVLEQYLKEIFVKLRPGGVLAMTFNDCDRAHCVALVEKKFCFYTPGGRVRATAKSIGYKQVFSWNDTGNLTWLELRKPGQVESLKGGQTLAKIIPKSLAKSK